MGEAYALLESGTALNLKFNNFLHALYMQRKMLQLPVNFRSYITDILL